MLKMNPTEVSHLSVDNVTECDVRKSLNVPYM
jgi:hypothetical protein